MHPAPSVILFTSLSGLGFGWLFWLGIWPAPPTGLWAFVVFALAYGLAVGGLLFSTFHLGHPERALKAFTQWRSSWLSREAWAAVATLVVMGLYAAGLVFFGTHLAPLGWLGAVLALGTVVTTAMIYTQLRTVPRWHHWTTPALFFGYALAGGAILCAPGWLAALLLAMVATLQVLAWVQGDGAFAGSGTTLATATGLGDRGRVRSFEPPHTGTNYLLDEMVYRVGRRRAAQLRGLALVLGAGVPILLLVLFPGPLWVRGLAATAHLAGVICQRWLFFAQAEHVVGLYYGRRG